MVARDRNVAVSLVAAGAAIMGASVVFGLTTGSGAVDWVEVLGAAAGLIVVLMGVIKLLRSGSPHTG